MKSLHKCSNFLIRPFRTSLSALFQLLTKTINMKQQCLSTPNQQYSLRFLLLFIVSFVVLVANSQTNNKPVYVSFNYMKTAPGKYNDYLRLVKTYSKKVQEYQFKQGAQLGWYLYEVLMPTGTKADYNFVIVIVGTDIQQMMDPVLTGREILQKADPTMTAQQLDSVPILFSAARSMAKR